MKAAFFFTTGLLKRLVVFLGIRQAAAIVKKYASVTMP